MTIYPSLLRWPIGCAVLAAISFSLPPRAQAAEEVSITINGKPATAGDLAPADIETLVIASGPLAISFGRDTNGDFSGTSVTMKGTELAHNLHGIEPRDVDRGRTFYLDHGAGRGHLEVDTVRISANTPELGHFAVLDTHNPIKLERHFVMRRGENGIYDYVIIRTDPNGGPRSGGGEMRTMYRFDRDILDHAWTMERKGQQPKYADLLQRPNVQDETWELADGTIYQKYDYCAYYAESPMWGHHGHGFGVFFMPVSNEAYAGGPLRQELIVHQDALILNYIGGGHFGGGGTAAGRDGVKMHGPWFLYFNTGPTPEAIVADAQARAVELKKQWPFAWVDEPLYQKARTNVSGQLHVTDGRSPAGAWVVLGQPGGDVYRMSGDYLFYAQADADGHFTLPNVRPGTYTLYAWATQGSITDQLEKPDIEIKGASTDLGAVDWSPESHGHVLWQIGRSDRMAGEFKFGDQLRNIKWVGMVHANLTFTIGESHEATDWYYAQTQVGHWDIAFNLAGVPSGDATLTVAIAGGGGGPSVDVMVNGETVKTIAPRNDSSTYRSAVRSGRYVREVITFPAALLKTGANTIRFDMTSKGERWNGIMYDTIVLEAAE